jgi:hypothetical protein
MPDKVYVTNYAPEADYQVCFVDHPTEQHFAQILQGCELTQFAGEAKIKVYITKQLSEASIKIMRDNFPKPR